MKGNGFFKYYTYTLCQECSYSKFSGPYISVFTPNARKYRPEKFQIGTLFM